MKYTAVYLGTDEDVGRSAKVRRKIKTRVNDLLNIHLVDCSRGGSSTVDLGVSKVLSKSEKKYLVTRKELLALFTLIKHFRPFFYGHKFSVITDQSSAKSLLQFKDPRSSLDQS